MNKRLDLAKMLFGAVLYFATGNLVMGAVLSVGSSNSTVGFSSSFAVDVSVKDVSDLYSYQFDIKFNPNLFSAVNVVEGPFLSGGGSTYFQPGTINNTTGDVTFVANTLLGAVPGVSGQGILASVSFQSLHQTGSGNFSLQNTILLDSGNPQLDIAHSTSSVAVGVVPEPEEWGMMLLGAGLVGFQVKRKKAKQAFAG